MKLEFLSKNSNQRLLRLVITATVATGGIAIYGTSQFGKISQNSSPELARTTPVVKKVTALGRLEPEAEVIKLFAPLALDSDLIAQILVKEGDRVKAGQVVAILNSRNDLQNALLQAEKQVNVAKAKLAQVKAGAKTGEIKAQEATIAGLQAQMQGDNAGQQETLARLEAQWQGDKAAQEATIKKLQAELNNAQSEFQRYQNLYSQGAISKSLFDSKRLSVDTTIQQVNEAEAILNRINTTAKRQISEATIALNRIKATGSQGVSKAKATLSGIAEVRPVDIAAAEAEVKNASSTFKRAETSLFQAYVRAPSSGQILKIHTRAGEKIGAAGILDLAETGQMVAVAEIYQTDISKIKLGQQAVITSQAFAGKLGGIVSHIGLQVNQQNVFSNQPGQNFDSRVIEVKIRLNAEDSKRVASLTNLQVQTAIHQ